FTINVHSINDAIDEEDETVQVTVGGVTATGTILDDDAPPTLTIESAWVNESAGTATFTVRLNGQTEKAVSVDYATADGTAKAGSDYVAKTGTLTFAPGETTKTITVAITDDTVFEGDTAETFLVKLLNPQNATVSGSDGTGHIQDNDNAPKISSISSPSVIEGGDLVFDIGLSAAAGVPTTHHFSVGGTATPQVDYGSTVTFSNGVTLSGTTLTVPAGVTSFTATFSTTNDTLPESSETVV